MIATAMNASGTVALVTGANRGIGRAFVEELLKRGAPRVYAGARDIVALAPLVATYCERVVPVELDVTDPASIREATSQCLDINLLVNNAGIASPGGVTGRPDLDGARDEMEVNYFGTLEMSRAFAPILLANQPAAIVNVLSILSLVTIPRIGTYSASKAAALAATRALRAELSPQGVLVVGVMPGFVDTDLTKNLDAPKMTPLEVAQDALDAVAGGIEDVFPGVQAAELSDAFFRDHKSIERVLAG
jgi:NAD(P)-dependent dehydrogenase (short-subunit alcohol dehydrogenase family)